jgi:preprotein translocase subunit SecB
MNNALACVPLPNLANWPCAEGARAFQAARQRLSAADQNEQTHNRKHAIMAEEGNVITSLDNFGNDEDTAPAAGILSQYVKDLSVENPNAPQSFQWQDAPHVDIQFNIGATPVEGEIHEVELKLALTAKAEAGVTYAIELAYCGLVGMRNLDEPQMHAFLYAEAPRILFPFARRILADAVRDTGFPPFMLEPIDFNSLYMQQLAAQAEGGAAMMPMGNA